jgi:putative DNA-invertase from lambdoid prophage Rac
MAKKVDRSPCRQQDVSGSRLIDDGLHQPLRARGALGQRHGKSQQLAVGISVEGATTEARHQLGDMLPAICRTLPIGRELRGRRADLIGDESQHHCGRCLGDIEHAARKAHATHEHGKPELIGRHPLLGDEVEIGPAQRVVPHDRPLVGSPRPERRQLLVGEKTAAGHRLSFSNFQTRGYLVRIRAPDLPGFQASSAEGVQVGQRAALYCRVSTADQSCDRQERDLRAFAKRSGFAIVGVYKEKASGAKTDRIERKKVMALAQAHEIDAILVTELSRWGRSTIDLVQTLQSLQAWDVSVLAVSGLQFDLSTPHGKMIASVMAALAEFERDLIRERIKSGIAAAKARGKRLGRQPGQRPSDRKATKVLKLAEAGLSYRLIGRHVGLSKNTVGAILQRARAAN